MHYISDFLQCLSHLHSQFLLHRLQAFLNLSLSTCQWLPASSNLLDFSCKVTLQRLKCLPINLVSHFLFQILQNDLISNKSCLQQAVLQCSHKSQMKLTVCGFPFHSLIRSVWEVQLMSPESRSQRALSSLLPSFQAQRNLQRCPCPSCQWSAKSFAPLQSPFPRSIPQCCEKAYLPTILMLGHIGAEGCCDDFRYLTTGDIYPQAPALAWKGSQSPFWTSPFLQSSWLLTCWRC